MISYRIHGGTRYHSGSADMDGNTVGVDIESVGLRPEVLGVSGVRLTGDVSEIASLRDALTFALEQAAELRRLQRQGRHYRISREFYGKDSAAEHECQIGPGVSESCLCPR